MGKTATISHLKSNAPRLIFTAFHFRPMSARGTCIYIFFFLTFVWPFIEPTPSHVYVSKIKLSAILNTYANTCMYYVRVSTKSVTS